MMWEICLKGCKPDGKTYICDYIEPRSGRTETANISPPSSMGKTKSKSLFVVDLHKCQSTYEQTHC